VAAFIHLGEALGIASLAIGVVGLAIAFWQIAKVRNTANAAKLAIEQEQRRIGGAMLLARTSDLEDAAQAMRRAVVEVGRPEAEDAINNWGRVASEHQALLTVTGEHDQQLASYLELSLSLVPYALEDLTAGEDVEQACRRLLSHATGACTSARRVANTMMLKP
jgi:uncharacterized protein HemX